MPSFDAHALVIGISAYQHLSPLPAKPDAEDMATALAAPTLCAYPVANVRTLLQAEATRERILAELTALAQRTSAGSTVFIYFSGHGGQAVIDGAATCFLMAVDSKKSTLAELKATAISGPELSEKLRAIVASKLTVVLDCCAASGVAEVRDATALAAAPDDAPLVPQLTPDVVGLLARGIGRAVLAASRADGFAYAMPQSRNGVFTGHLLDGLRGQAPGHGGVIRLFDLFHFVQQRTSAETAQQRPVLKAEIEENYPVALYLGGAAPQLVLPDPGDGFRYDAFLSFSQSARADAEWVRNLVVPRLEQLGIKLCLEERDFRLGRQRLREMERAVKESRYTVGVFSPAYLEGPFEDFQTALAQHQAVEQRSPRFIPLLRTPCHLSLITGMTQLLDVSDDRQVEPTLQRLAVALREPVT
jgi:Caspase domain/TIR domain